MIFLSGLFGFFILNHNFSLLPQNAFEFLLLLEGILLLAVGVEADEFLLSASYQDDSCIKIVFQKDRTRWENVKFDELYEFSEFISLFLIEAQ